MAFFFKLSYSKVRASFTLIPRQGRPFLVDAYTLRGMFRILSVTWLLINPRRACAARVAVLVSCVCVFGGENKDREVGEGGERG